MPTKISQCLLVLTLKLEDHTSEVVYVSLQGAAISSETLTLKNYYNIS